MLSLLPKEPSCGHNLLQTFTALLPARLPILEQLFYRHRMALLQPDAIVTQPRIRRGDIPQQAVQLEAPPFTIEEGEDAQRKSPPGGWPRLPRRRR